MFVTECKILNLILEHIQNLFRAVLFVNYQEIFQLIWQGQIRTSELVVKRTRNIQAWRIAISSGHQLDSVAIRNTHVQKQAREREITQNLTKIIIDSDGQK